jgi:hypothetical protein
MAPTASQTALQSQPPIDLSAGLVPKALPSGGVDISAGLVPISSTISNAQPQATIGPQPKVSDVDSGAMAQAFAPNNPIEQAGIRLSMPLVKALADLHDKLRDTETMTQEGAQQHPIQAKIGELANSINELLLGGQSAGKPMGTREGILNNPVTSLMAVAPGAAEEAPEAAEAVGSAISKGAQTAKGIGKVIPSAERAGKALEEVQAAAGSIPVDVTEPEKIAIETQRLSKSGGRMPKVINDWLRRTEHAGQPVTYQEARDFYSNATRLSGDEASKLTPVMQRQVARFTQALRQSTKDAADQVNKAEQFEKGMQEFHAARKMESREQFIKDTVAQAVKSGLKYGTALWIAHKIWTGEL